MNNQFKHRVLIVDDEPANIKVLGESLKSEYTVQIATSGPGAIEVAASDSPPDLILLDIAMPEMDGFEVCKRLKSNGKTKNVPIIFITAHTEIETEIKCFKSGAVDFITKPFSPVVAQARVKMHLELKKHRDYLKQLLSKKEEELRVTEKEFLTLFERA